MLPQYGGPSLTAASDQSNTGSPLGTTSFGTSKNSLPHAKPCQCVRKLDQGIDRVSSARENPCLLRVGSCRASHDLERALCAGFFATRAKITNGRFVCVVCCHYPSHGLAAPTWAAAWENNQRETPAKVRADWGLVTGTVKRPPLSCAQLTEIGWAS